VRDLPQAGQQPLSGKTRPDYSPAEAGFITVDIALERDREKNEQTRSPRIFGDTADWWTGLVGVRGWRGHGLWWFRVGDHR
jgi:hypothetical protein